MKRFRASSISSILASFLIVGLILVAGCSDSLTGPTQPEAEENVTVQQASDHSATAQDDTGNDEKDDGHNQTGED